jgi:hypothetical protein
MDFIRIERYDGEELFCIGGGTIDSPNEQFFALNEAGNIRDSTYAELGYPPFLYRYPDHYVFIDEDQNVLVETDGYFNTCGDFVILKERVRTDGDFSMRTSLKAIYDFNGRILLDDLYGCIDESPGPGGGLIVYLGKNACLLLNLDGSMVPIPTAPAVEQIYWGG